MKTKEQHSRGLGKHVEEARKRARSSVSERYKRHDPSALVIDPDARVASRLAHIIRQSQRPSYRAAVLHDERGVREAIKSAPWLLIARADHRSLDAVGLLSRVGKLNPHIELVAVCSRAAVDLRAQLLGTMAPMCFDVEEAEEHLPALLSLLGIRRRSFIEARIELDVAESVAVEYGPHVASAFGLPRSSPRVRTLAEAEREALAAALQAADGVKANAARYLDVSRKVLYDRMRKHGFIK